MGRIDQILGRERQKKAYSRIDAILGRASEEESEALPAQPAEGPAIPPDVDLTREGSLGDRVVYDLLGSTEAREQFLTSRHPGWEYDAEGRVLVPGPAGSGRRHYFDRPGPTMADVGDLAEEGFLAAGSIAGAAAIPETAGAVGLGLLTREGLRRAGVGGLRSGAAALAGQTAGAGGEVAAKTATGAPLDLPEMVERRSQDAVVDLAFDLGFGATLLGIRKGMRYAAAPRQAAARRPLEIEAARAYADAEKRFGVTIPRPLWSLGEAPRAFSGFAERLPFSGRPVVQRARDFDDLTLSLQNRAFGEPVDEADLGAQVLDEYKGQWNGAMLRAEEIRQRELQALSGRAQTSLARIERGAPVRSVIEAQQAVREGVFARKAVFQERANQMYAPIEAELGDAKVFSLQGVIDKLKAKRALLLKRKPEQTDEEAIVQDLFELEGADLEGTEGKVAREYVPSWLMGWIDGADRLDPDVSLAMLRDFRRNIDNHIESGVAIAGLDTKFLAELSEIASDALDAGVVRAGGEELATLLRQANQFYREGRKQFFEPGIARLFKRADELGFVEDENILAPHVRQGNLAVLQRFKALLGPESQEWRSMRGSLVRSWIQESSTLYDEGLEGSLSGSGFFNEFNAIWKKSPQALREVLGEETDEFVKVARMLKAGEDRIDADILRKIDDPSARGLLRALEEQRRVVNEYETEVIRPFLRGEINEAAIERNPVYLVQHLMTRQHLPTLERVLAKVNPDTRDLLQRRARQVVLQDSMTTLDPEAAAAAGLLEQAPRIKGTLLLENLGAKDPTRAARMKRVLGEAQWESLRDLGIIFSTGERRSDMAGSLARGAVFASILSGGAISGAMGASPVAGGLLPILTARAISAFTHSPAGVKWLSRDYVPHFEKSFRVAAAAGGQSIARVIEEIGKEFYDRPDLRDALIEELQKSLQDKDYSRPTVIPLTPEEPEAEPVSDPYAGMRDSMGQPLLPPRPVDIDASGRVVHPSRLARR